MKKNLRFLTAILVISCLFILFFYCLTEPWLPSFNEMRVVKMGISIDSVEKTLGKPKEIELNSMYEDWTYKYRTENFHVKWMTIYVKDGKVIQFFSY
jgi:hypothetical protein